MLEPKSSKCSSDAFRVLAVIVLYQMQPKESAAYRTLMESKSDLQQGQDGIRILLYDNTPGGGDPGTLPEGVRYKAAEQNMGLAVAYNYALSMAQREKCTWLLTLDQDTTLPQNYLSRMSKLAIDLDSDNKIAAIVPRLTDAGRPLSPASIGVWGEKQFSADFVGIARGETRALNSASMLRVNALRKIGGYDPYFWLDYVDISMYRRLYLYGWKVYVAGDIHVKHELSLLHRADIKTDRFQNILRAESAFCDLYDGRIRGFVLTGRLLGRMWRQKKRGDSVAIRQLTWNALKRRLLQSRTRRIQDWKSETGHRMSCSLGAAQCGELSTNRSPISVCMAAYNGERYIVAQLQSILSQLAVEDEVIVVDDASTDGTRDRVRSLRDCRIQLIEHSRNLGVSRTFEDAIRKVKNSTIFLSDQDDLWVADKVSTVLHAFRQHPEANIVVSDAALIDDKDAPVEPSYYARRGRFRSGVLANVFRCSYLGCTMAFRSSILPKILPFPTGADVLHDVWIGTLNSLTDGKTLYVDRPLVLYRRHECNATGNKRLSMARQIRIRWDLCRSLAIFWLDSHRANDK